MPNWRRMYVPGGTFFFTLVTDGRAKILRDPPGRPLLGSMFRRCQLRWPFTINAIVLLPEHVHAIWSLPPGDTAYPRRWAWIKSQFTRAWLELGGSERRVTAGRRRDGRRGVWQPKYWEHTIKDENDFERHFDYIHFNPVKHGHVRYPREWPWSSFHRWVDAGVYERAWACGGGADPNLDFSDIEETVGE